MTPAVRLLIVMRCWVGAGLAALWGSKLLASKYSTNYLIKSVAVQMIFVTYSKIVEIRKCMH